MLSLTLVLFFLSSVRADFDLNSAEESIKFYVQTESGSQFVSTFHENNFTDYGCSTSDPVTIVIHGWIESCYDLQRPWSRDVPAKFLKYRGNCVICMDYSELIETVIGDTFSSFKDMYNVFADISAVLTKKLVQLEQAGFDMEEALIFAFSYGAHVAFEGAANFGYQKIGRIDACDPVGAGFTVWDKIKAMNASKHTQCIHTDRGLGTAGRYCHSDWLMGYCGELQNGQIFRSHLLCPYFYESAFENEFPAIPDPHGCDENGPKVQNFTGIRMGYWMPKSVWEAGLEDKDSHGILFAQTYPNYPFNEQGASDNTDVAKRAAGEGDEEDDLEPL